MQISDWYALCYVTPKETCRLANHIGVKDGIIVHRIVAPPLQRHSTKPPPSLTQPKIFRSNAPRERPPM